MHAAQSFKLDPVVLDGFHRTVSDTPKDDAFGAAFVEGSKARAIVDLCARLHLPAIFIDQHGRVFHATEEVRPHLGAALDIRMGELVGRTPTATDRIQDVVSQALCAMGPDVGRRPIRLASPSPLHLTVLDYPNSSPSQLLKAVVVIERQAGERQADMNSLAGLLDRG